MKHRLSLSLAALATFALLAPADPAAGQAEPSSQPPDPQLEEMAPQTPDLEEAAEAAPEEAADALSPEAAAAAAAPAAPAGPLDLFRAYSRAQLQAAGFTRQLAFVEGYRFVWWEKGTGPSLVMIHGVADQAGTWFQVASALAEDHRVMLVDLPGHGESEPAEGPLAMTTVVEGFETWLSRHALAADKNAPKEPAILVGNSMGAWVALLAARRHPEWVERVVMVNGGPLRRANEGTDGLNLLPKTREEARNVMAALRDPSNPATPDPVLDDLVRRAKDGEVSRMFAEQQNLESYLLNERAMGTIFTPVDILWGESDRYMGADYPERLASHLSNTRVTLIPKCGHLPQAECPESFQENLTKVLAQAPPGSKGRGNGKKKGKRR